MLKVLIKLFQKFAGLGRAQGFVFCVRFSLGLILLLGRGIIGDMPYYILDLEYNQFFDFRESGPRPEPACPSEIIQMGLVVMDDKFNIKQKHETLVKPQIFRRLHPHVARVTGLEMANLRTARTFPDAFEDFFSFAFGKRGIFCTWGNDDIKELFRNILYYDLNHKRLSRRFLNVQHLFSTYKNTKESVENPTSHYKQTALKTAIESLGLPAERPFHTALSDAEYTSDILKHVLCDKTANLCAQPQTLNIKELQDNIVARTTGINIRLLYTHAERAMRRKLTERDKSALLEIYTMGKQGKFDSKRNKKKSKD